jgi:hypothetical protein
LHLLGVFVDTKSDQQCKLCNYSGNNMGFGQQPNLLRRCGSSLENLPQEKLHNSVRVCDAYPHALLPPHTPQLSTTAPTQHSPDGGRAEVQHVPSASTATPLPPHVPQASTVPERQHCPAASIGLPSGQHRPVMESTYPKQHPPTVSTMPSQGGLPAAGLTKGVLHPLPSQPFAHSHWCVSRAHTQRLLSQSASELQLQEASMVHKVTALGLGTPGMELRHTLSGTVAPEAVAQRTALDWVPWRGTQRAAALAEAFTGVHSPQPSVVHATTVAGHRNRLHGRCVVCTQ